MWQYPPKYGQFIGKNMEKHMGTWWRTMDPWWFMSGIICGIMALYLTFNFQLKRYYCSTVNVAGNCWLIETDKLTWTKLWLTAICITHIKNKTCERRTTQFP
jgi:hypothetical protein